MLADKTVRCPKCAEILRVYVKDDAVTGTLVCCPHCIEALGKVIAPGHLITVAAWHSRPIDEPVEVTSQ